MSLAHRLTQLECCVPRPGYAICRGTARRRDAGASHCSRRADAAVHADAGACGEHGGAGGRSNEGADRMTLESRPIALGQRARRRDEPTLILIRGGFADGMIHARIGDAVIDHAEGETVEALQARALAAAKVAG
jgi:hypothetical protein